jgi:hypothetical protein
MSSLKTMMQIEVLPIEKIHPHEEYDPQILLEITNSIRMEGVVHDPLLVESDHLMILDGTHRYWALTRLGCPSVPVALYNYKSDNVKVGCWYRCSDSAPDFDISNFLRGRETSVEEGLVAVRTRFAEFSIIFKDHSYTSESELNISDAYRFLSILEYGMRGRGHKVTYATESDALKMLNSGEISTIFATPPIMKEEAIQAAITGKLFPKKSTRHIIPSRPMGLEIPLRWLREDVASANLRLKKMLKGGNFKKTPAGSIINGRRYEEEVYIFESENFGGGSNNK